MFTCQSRPIKTKAMSQIEQSEERCWNNKPYGNIKLFLSTLSPTQVWYWICSLAWPSRMLPHHIRTHTALWHYIHSSPFKQVKCTVQYKYKHYMPDLHTPPHMHASLNEWCTFSLQCDLHKAWVHVFWIYLHTLAGWNWPTPPDIPWCPSPENFEREKTANQNSHRSQRDPTSPTSTVIGCGRVSIDFFCLLCSCSMCIGMFFFILKCYFHYCGKTNCPIKIYFRILSSALLYRLYYIDHYQFVQRILTWISYMHQCLVTLARREQFIHCDLR
jgi:hypothetical protein